MIEKKPNPNRSQPISLPPSTKPERNPSPFKNNSIRTKLVFWNAQSLNSLQKIYPLIYMNSDILLIQEVWQPKFELNQYFDSNAKFQLRKGERGGGTLLWVRNILHKLNRSIFVNKDFSIHRILLGRDKYVWMASVYLSQGTASQIQLLFKKILEGIPVEEWDFLIIAGDFNVNLKKATKKRELLQCLAKQFKLQIVRTHEDTHKNGELDYILCGQSIEIEDMKAMNSLSDHKIISCNLKIPVPSQKASILLPNKKLASRVTIENLLLSQNSDEFLLRMARSRKALKNRIMIRLRKTKRPRPYIQTLLSSHEDEEFLLIIRKYWDNFHKEIENQRFSPSSKSAFQYLKKAFKYSSKREGSVINVLYDDNGGLITNPNEVASEIIKTINELQVDKAKQSHPPLPFPKIEGINVDSIVDRMWNGKAISVDLISDDLFKPEYKEKTKEVFRDLWKSNLEKLSQDHFKCRLVPLNKKHPNIPNRKEMRPIIIMSTLTKILEGGLLDELMQYLTERLHPSQTGFVPSNGIFVNLFRVINRVHLRTSKKKRCFGLFIDFSSAYNTINHEKLFQKLSTILDENKIKFLQAIYSRLKICMLKNQVSPNQGVAQGSMISPALFDIYIEELLRKIECTPNMSLEDILSYADDLLIICDSIELLKSTLQVIQIWSEENNLKLNPNKSGIIEFCDRRQKPILKLDMIDDIPVLKEYKYLGLILNQKLTISSQLQQIKINTTDICRKLGPFLYNAEADTKKSLWQLFIQPLFDFLMPLFASESAKTWKNKAIKMTRYSFKLFLKLTSSTSNSLVDSLSGYNLEERSHAMKLITKKKWEARKAGSSYHLEEDPELRNLIVKPKNLCRRLPREFITYLNLEKSLCKFCGTVYSVYHLNSQHGANLISRLKLS